MWTKELLDKIKKEDLISECGLGCKLSDKKSVVIDKAYVMVENDELLGHRINNKYGDRIAIHPTKMEEMLGITKTERKRWADRFKVRYYDSFNKYGKSFEYPMYDYFAIASISEDTISEWRNEHDNCVSENRKIGVQKAKETRKNNKQKVKDFYNTEWVSMIERWKSVDLELANTYQLAFWTMWVSRTAKLFHEKALRSRLHKQEYIEKKDHFYELKNKGIELLSRSKYSTVSFYSPEVPDKIKVKFCDVHYDIWCRLRRDMEMDKWDYYYFNKEDIHKCKKCAVDIQKDYYSLYYLEIVSDKITDIKFSFHTPYPLGKKILKSPENYKKVCHEENLEGLFRFGRSLDEDEVVIFSENKVLKYFNNAVESYVSFYERKHEVYLVKTEQ